MTGKRRAAFFRWPRRGLAAVVWACLAASVCGAMAGVQWQPGFPMRAGNQVLLMWLPSPGADSYQVVRRDLASQEERRWTVVVTQYVDTEAPTERSFAYTVQAQLAGGLPGGSSEAKVLEGFRPLLAPQWVGNYQEAGNVHLVWEAVEGAAFYNLYRSVGESAPGLLASVQDTKYVDATVRNGESYRYVLRAVGLQSQESPSSEALRIAVGADGATGVVEAPAAQRRVRVEAALSGGDPFSYRLREPTDCAAWGAGFLVTDLGSRSALYLEADGDLVVQFGVRPPEYAGEWGIPWGIGVGPQGRRVALTFLRTPNVRLFAPDWALTRDFVVGKPPGFEEDPRVPQPMDVAVDGTGDLWVSDYTYAQLVRLDDQGREWGRVGVPRGEPDAGPFRSPTFLTYDPAGNRLFVVDSLLARVFVVGMDGQIQAQWGRPKGPAGALNLPKGIALTRDGELLVVDGIRSSLQTFTPEGLLRAVYYTPEKEYLELRGLVSVAEDPKTGNLFAVSKVDSTVYRLRVSVE